VSARRSPNAPRSAGVNYLGIVSPWRAHRPLRSFFRRANNSSTGASGPVLRCAGLGLADQLGPVQLRPQLASPATLLAHLFVENRTKFGRIDWPDDLGLGLSGGIDGRSEIGERGPRLFASAGQRRPVYADALAASVTVAPVAIMVAIV
jgi:hypothetical protein